MTCPDCKIARSFDMYRMYNTACIYCGARLIQNLARLPIAISVCSEMRKKVLADWVEFGHSEAEIRALVKGPLAIGPEKKSESAHRTTTKRPSVRKR